ncbi:MAG TPA: PIN domain-containing protein [Ktedonobacterales bacterium]
MVAEGNGTTDPGGSVGGPAGSSGPLHALFDTNVILDLLLQRDPWYTEAIPMWEARDQGRFFAYVPASALTDVFYLCRKQIGIQAALAAIEMCVIGFNILTVDRAIIEAALALPGADFEDNVQIACAQAAGLDLIITRNASDFAQAGISVIAPPDVPAWLGV